MSTNSAPLTHEEIAASRARLLAEGFQPSSKAVRAHDQLLALLASHEAGISAALPLLDDTKLRESVRRVQDAITAQHEAICQFAVEHGLSPTEITGCHQEKDGVCRFWLERVDEKDPDKVAFFRQENYRLRQQLAAVSEGNEVNTNGACRSIADLTAEVERLREAFRRFISQAMTFRKVNTDEWAEWFEKEAIAEAKQAFETIHTAEREGA